jgi:hypothetical protein
VEEAEKMAILHKGELYTYFDEGLTRHVFVNPDQTKVIKIEQSHSGNFNQIENDIYQKASPETKKQMVPTTLVNGLIEQDFVTPIKFGGIKLTIAQRLFASSCRNEVGWDKDGNLVCFDLDEYKKY